MAAFGPATTPEEEQPLLSKLEPGQRLPIKNRPQKPHGQTLAALVVVPWGIFVVVACSVVLLYSAHPFIVHVIRGLCYLIAGFLVFLNFWNPKLGGPIYLWLGGLSALAIIVASIFGHRINDDHMSRYWSYKYRPTYTNVLPNEPAEAVKDAGVIGYSDDTKLDLQRTLGYKFEGHTYCVAPVLDATQHVSVQFWAVGTDCCESRWGFVCDDALEVTAKTGTVIPEIGPSGLASWQYDQYLIAAKQSAAYYRLYTPEKPVFVRWVKDVTLVENEAFWSGLIGLLVACVVYLCVSAVLAILLHLSSAQSRPSPTPSL